MLRCKGDGSGDGVRRRVEDAMHQGPVTRSMWEEFVQPRGPCFVWDAVRHTLEQVRI